MADLKEIELPIAADCNWVRGLDASGNPIRISKADMVELIRANMPVATIEKNGLMSARMAYILNHLEIRTSKEGGGGILAEGVGFCFGYDRETPNSYCLYSFVRESGQPACIRDKIAGILSLGNQNSQGTSIINGATDYFSITLM